MAAAVEEILREESERVVAQLLNERERMLYHLCTLIAEREAEGVPDSFYAARARMFLAEQGIHDCRAVMERGETGRKT